MTGKPSTAPGGECRVRDLPVPIRPSAWLRSEGGRGQREGGQSPVGHPVQKEFAFLTRAAVERASAVDIKL